MDWTTIRVLTKNLRELLSEIDSGTHLEENIKGIKGPLGTATRESWRVGILTVLPSLLAELGLKEEVNSIHSSFKEFDWPLEESFKDNPYIRRAKATLEIAEKLISDYDAENKKETPNQ
jgi:hypothetical protein